MRCCNPRLYPITFITISELGKYASQEIRRTGEQASHRTAAVFLTTIALGDRARCFRSKRVIKREHRVIIIIIPRDPRSIEGTSTCALARSRFQLAAFCLTRFRWIRCLSCCFVVMMTFFRGHGTSGDPRL